MMNTRIDYARCSTDKQDLAAQKDALLKLGAAADRIYTDHGFTGMSRARPGLDQALAHTKGKQSGKKPKLSDHQQKELRRMYDTGEYSISDLAEMFSISRPTVYRTLGRQAAATSATA
jgi:DNA invertase Pin-like site-specific DNA recombinase